MVGAGRQVLARHGCDLLGAPMRDDRVDQPVGPSSGDVLVAETVAQQVVCVVTES